MEQHTKKHARHSFYHLKNALGGLKIAMRGAFLNIKSMLALQIIYSIFYTLIEYSLFQLLLSIALKIDGYSFLNSANIGRFLITPPAIAMLLILFLTACMLTYLNACILLGGFQAVSYTHLFYRFSGNDVILEFHLSYAPDTPLRRIFRACGLVAAGVGVFCFLYYGIYNGALLAERPLSPVQIYCHRGLSSEAPENSLEAIDLAISSLSDGVEIDVQETKDGVVIVCHDSSLKRIAGKKINIADVTYEELKQYDISYYFSKDHEFTYIPTLEEVMSLVKGRAHLLIELKRNSASADLAAKVVGLIEQYEMEYQCSIQSADYAYLRQVNELNPDLTLGYILTTAIGNYYKNDMIDFFCVRSMFVNNTTVAKAHAQGKAVYAWTINTRAEAERMKNAQVDVIITDYPAKAREVIYRDERSSYSIIKLLRLML